ncbi:hypothetical protein CEXT_398081 [Caerostris extrusa]|uniref:Core Histone H2A/H2B/H3 domain-containing protein n=1 Tax=Caerostris extrusa TaxID=172846 RepID=A0AAV4NH39_CAEEX|nr:hypothetical protein CEXT_398081 [Caerostris extrusa]
MLMKTGVKDRIAKKTQLLKRKKRIESYAIYISRVLKQIDPECGISRDALSEMNFYVNFLFCLIVEESSKLVKISKRCTITERDIETAIRLLMPGELSRQAILEATRAVNKFMEQK